MEAYSQTTNPLLTPLTNSLQCCQAFRKIWKRGTYEKHECVYAIYLNRKREHIYHEMLNRGSYSETNFDLRTAMFSAIGRNSCHIIIAHNHTSGNINPSGADKCITAQLSHLCKSLDINLVDHIIITKDDYFSFRDHELL